MFKTSVISGAGRGKGLGFPTLNMVIPEDLTAEHGIYAGWVWISEEKFQGAFHFGPIPQFADAKPSLEVYLLNTDIEEPPKTVRVELIKRLREIKHFPTVDDMLKQIALDVKECEEVLK